MSPGSPAHELVDVPRGTVEIASSPSGARGIVRVGERERGRLVGLDLLRVLGAVLVFWVHVTPVAFGSDPTAWPAFNGRLGVYIFFTLSGYLLTRQLLPGADLNRYLLTRAARILPAYWAALIGITLLTGTTVATDAPLRYVTMTQAWFPPTYGPLQPTWTLSVEALFYVSLPFLVLLLRHSGGALVLTALAIVSLLLMGDPTRMDAAPLMLWAFLPGMLVAWAEPRLPRWLTFPGVALMVVAILGGSGVLTAIGAALTIAGVRSRTGNGARIPADLSYAFYLWQDAIIVSMPLTGGLLVIGAFGASVLVAAGSWFGLERPVLLYARDKLRQRPRERHGLDGGDVGAPVVGVHEHVARP